MWYNRVIENMAEIPSAIDYYNFELVKAQEEARIKGNLEKNAQELAGITSYRFTQLQELEAILKYLNIKYDKLRSDLYRKYNERYNRELTDRSIEKYIDGEEDIVALSNIINEVALVRNKYLGLIKGLEQKSYMIGHIVRLRTVGMENVTMGYDNNN